MTTIQVDICLPLKHKQSNVDDSIVFVLALSCSSLLHQERRPPTNKGCTMLGWFATPQNTTKNLSDVYAWMNIILPIFRTDDCHLPLVSSLDVIRPQEFILLPKYYTPLNAVIGLLFMGPKWLGTWKFTLSLSSLKLWHWKFTQSINAHMGTHHGVMWHVMERCGNSSDPFMSFITLPKTHQSQNHFNATRIRLKVDFF